MNVEYTGRQYEVTPAVRKQVEHGLGKLEKLFGSTFDSHVILTLEKHRHIAEITIKVRNHPIVGIAESTDMSVAVGEALDKIDRQAIKYKTRWRSKKRHARKTQWSPALPKQQAQQMAVGSNVATAVPVVVHSFPAVAKLTEAHVVKSADSVAMRPMTLEEAVKEAEFRDRDVFVFRDPEGRVKVLHRKKDGKMELIEAP
ncbi:MAG: ribosome-associated translation inhibitor RaiA [Acidobacteria bacterium]|nr:MAG: ribosome-associated translation inhibitor RaiA [Acidobacteriota bacterium]PYX99976.1 MAG: ribosome-associated translation inhibitor RaiA [Acidobacteriota bacterium]